MNMFGFKRRIVASLTAIAVLTLSWVAAVHRHAPDEAKASTETCSVCVAGHQVKSGAVKAVDKLAAPILQDVSLIELVPENPGLSLVSLESARAPPSA